MAMRSRGLFGRKLMDIEFRERELASPGPGQVIVAVRACGICGTDVNFVRDWTGDAMALGHEISAKVVETGPGVTRLAAGDRVVVEDCTMCRPGFREGSPGRDREWHAAGGEGGYRSIG
jgi:threonine dehydrogenase-like Zn-dependent dehydrogenase